ncbi:MAG: hypothetical protein JW841_11135 [Deltaproteobacteria bacterium]|nr:hypothetical protein [Deltaproteobacteria bacterium]
MKTNVFKFVALRAADSSIVESRTEAIVHDERTFSETPVGLVVIEKDPPTPVATILQQVRDLIASSGYDAAKRPEILLKLNELYTHYKQTFDVDKFTTSLNEILNATPAEFVADDAFTSLLSEAWDTLYAHFIIKRVEPIDLGGMLQDLRILKLVQDVAKGKKPTSAAELAAYDKYLVVVPKRLANFAPAKSTNPNADPNNNHQPAPDKVAAYDAFWHKFGDLYNAKQELEKTEWQHKKETTDTPATGSDNTATETQKKVTIKTQIYKLTIGQKSLAALSPSTKQWLTKNSNVENHVDLAAVSNKLNSELAALQSKIMTIKDSLFFERLPRDASWADLFINLANFRLYPGILFGSPPAPDEFSAPLAEVKPLGVGDLKVVKQKFEKYSASEIAHIENVLQGEYKERKHRQLDRVEDIITTSEENLKEVERDTQKTDRYELKKESEQIIKTDMEARAGLTVSASYGPVSIGARADFAYGTSSSTTTRNSSNFAREIVDRAVEKIQKKTREERIHKVLSETEEINLHGIDNKTGTGNIAGIYRWVDKHYRAQVHNYGRRLMFEFVIPEPAAFLRYSSNEAAKADTDRPPLIPLGNITHRDIQDWNYHEYIQRYAIQGVTPPPPQFTTVTTSLASGDIPAGVARGDASHSLSIPDGYVAKYWTGRTQSSMWATGSDVGLTIIVGNGRSDGLLNDEDTSVPIAIHTLNIAAFGATIEVHCERTPRHFEEWQIATFEKILAAYQSLLAQREAPNMPNGLPSIAISGRNPAMNREIEKTELKKNCITILSNQYYGSFDAIKNTPPEIDIAESLSEAHYIQFFEQAFEWEQMTYLFYPYFWGRKSQWTNVLGQADVDPLFEQFLKAGAARVLIPVHPIFNEAVLYYMQTGNIWNGGEAPSIADPLYVALWEELRDQQDDLEGAIAEGEPWSVVIPTSLVYLQQDFSLQTTNDELNPPTES